MSSTRGFCADFVGAGREGPRISAEAKIASASAARRLALRSALLAGASATVLTLFASAPAQAYCIGCSTASTTSATTAAMTSSMASAAQAAQIAQNAQNALARAAQAIQAMQAVQSTARSLALTG